MARSPLQVLLIKTSSMGDLVHSLSAIQEAVQAHGPFQLDWVCEEGFTDIANLAPCIDRIIPLAIRRWRKSILAASTRAEIRQFTQALRARDYDVVIDAQGLLKTAWVTRLARCKSSTRWGYDWASAREPLASLAVSHHVRAPSGWHAIERLRTLFGAALGYTPQGVIPSLRIPAAQPEPCKSAIIFLHGTSRIEKSWPVECWIKLGHLLVAQGHQILLPWGSDQERQQAEHIAREIGVQNAQVLPRLRIAELVKTFQESAGAIGVDSGLMHLSVVIGRPTVAVMAASHIAKFSAKRFAPYWASHAKVLESSDGHVIAPSDVLHAWRQLS